MAYRVEDWPIVPGSLNLLQPGNKLEKGDALQLANWRADQMGELKQRRGCNALHATGRAAYVHSIELLNSVRFYAAGTALYDIARGSVDTGYSGNPLGLVPFQGWLWIMDSTTGKQRKDNGTNTWDWTTETPGTVTATAAGSGGSLAAGDHQYYVTFTTDSGHEGNPSPVKTVTAALNDKITVTQPAHTEAVVTGWNVYVKRPLPGLIYRLHDNALLLTDATYADYGDDNASPYRAQSNDSLMTRNAVLEQYHDDAPRASVLAGPYDGRLLAGNTVEGAVSYPHRIRYTESLRPWFFPSDNYVDVGDSFDPIYAITIWPRMVMVYKQRSIWRILGDINDGLVELVVPKLGAVGPRAVAHTDRGDFLASKEGVYRCNGDSVVSVGQKIAPILKEEHIPVAYGISHVAASDADRDKTAIGYRGGRLWVSIPSGSPVTYPGYVLDLESQRWVTCDQQFRSYFDEGQGGDLLAGGNGFLFALEDGYEDDVPNAGGTLTSATGVQMYFQTKYEDQGHPDRLKTYDDLVIEHNTQGRSMTVKVVTNDGQTAGDIVLLGTVSSTVKTRSVVRILNNTAVVRAYNLAVRLEVQGATGAALPIEVFSAVVHYFLEPRGAKSFDSDETDHGVQGPKWIDEIELDIEAPSGTYTVTMYSDVPGGAMATRLVATKSATSGRQKVTVPAWNAGAPYEGKLFRYTVHSAYEFRLYGLRAHLGVIGVHMDGSVTGSKWQTREVAVGV